jgi:ferritin-like metal-binding protein YciE
MMSTTLRADSTLYNHNTFYIAGLHNAHAMETQAIQIISRQLERLEDYPDMAAKLRQHLAESEAQRTRLDEVLATLEEKHSMLKDTALGFMGNMMALAHTPAPDEVVKNTLANYAFEHFEIAAYKSLITISETLGHSTGASAARASLAEEEAMADWIADHIGSTVLQFMGLKDVDLKVISKI